MLLAWAITAVTSSGAVQNCNVLPVFLEQRAITACGLAGINESRRTCDMADVKRFTSECVMSTSTPRFNVYPSDSTCRDHRCRHLPASRLYGTCAVVSSSGVLLGSGCGGMIDSYDMVARVNSPVVKGFEADVGSRTSLSTIGTVIGLGTLRYKRRVGSRSRFITFQGAPVVILDTAYPGRYPRFFANRRRAEAYMEMYRTPAVWMLADRWFQSFRSYWGRIANSTSGDHAGQASTGVITVMMLLTMCVRVAIFGFSVRDPGQPYRYWESSSRNLDRGNENTRFEYDILRAFASAQTAPFCLVKRRSGN